MDDRQGWQTQWFVLLCNGRIPPNAQWYGSEQEAEKALTNLLNDAGWCNDPAIWGIGYRRWPT